MAPPAGPGWVIQLTGHHYHNSGQTHITAGFVAETLIKNLEEGSVQLPDGPNDAMIDVPLKDLSINHAWLVADKELVDDMIDPDAELYGEGGRPIQFGGGDRGDEGGPAAGATPTGPVSRAFTVKRYDFVVQFCWQPKTRAERQELATARAAAEQAAREAAEAAGGGDGTTGEQPVEATVPADDLTTAP